MDMLVVSVMYSFFKCFPVSQWLIFFEASGIGWPVYYYVFTFSGMVHMVSVEHYEARGGRPDFGIGQ